jgi:hypothetical protein
MQIQLSDEVLGPRRIAFAVTVTFDDGKRIIEHKIAHVRDGLIARQADVEAWD